jgi:hypothetical protein
MRDHRRKFGAAVAVALALVALPSSGQANLIQNGNFAGCAGTTCSPWVFVPAAQGSNFEFLLGSFQGPMQVVMTHSLRRSLRFQETRTR